MHRAPFALGLALAALLASSLAGADLAPGPGYVESCTLDKQQKSGEECVKCAASFEDAEACQTKHESSGMQQRCKTAGASVWTEIWCRAKAAPAAASAAEPESAPAASATPVAPSSAPEKSGSCGACAAVGKSPSDAALGASAVLFAALWLRRRRAG